MKIFRTYKEFENDKSSLPEGIARVIINNQKHIEEELYEAYVINKKDNKLKILEALYLQNSQPEFKETIDDYQHDLYILGNAGKGVSIFYPL